MIVHVAFIAMVIVHVAFTAMVIVHVAFTAMVIAHAAFTAMARLRPAPPADVEFDSDGCPAPCRRVSSSSTGCDRRSAERDRHSALVVSNAERDRHSAVIVSNPDSERDRHSTVIDGALRTRTSVDEDGVAHFSKCAERRSGRRCPQCTWHSNKRKWTLRLPLLSDELLKQHDITAAQRATHHSASWAYLGVDADQRACVMCIACKGAVVHRMTIDKLLEHHKCTKHVENVKDMFEVERGPAGKSVKGAPSEEAFRLAWELAPRVAEIVGVGCEKKVTSMQRCIVEAMVQIERDFLASAESITIMRDESKGRLVVRYIAVSAALERRSGLLGVSKEPGSDAFDITDATDAIIMRFCDPSGVYAGKKLVEEDEGKRRQTALADHVRSKIEAVCVDSAANETKSARLMKKPTDPTKAPVAPNLKAIIRDRAHASRRMTSRPWAVDEFLSNLAEKVVMDRHSIVQRIQKSVALQRRFEAQVKALSKGPFKRVTCLKAAKHRFESWAAPFGRATLHIEALIKTAESISAEGSAWKDDADAFLRLLMGDGEVYLQLAMIADAADEALLVTRLFDTEDCDSATTLDDLGNFKKRIHVLFGESTGCFHMQGYTHFACDYLASGPHPIKIRGSIAGYMSTVSEHVKQRCIARMRNWIDLCSMVINAEFPDFELVSAFSVFNLASQVRSGRRRGNVDEEQRAVQHRALERLALAFSVNADALKHQFFDHIDLAQQRYIAARCSNMDAWVSVVSQPRRNHAVNVLRQILCRYMALGVSTSGVEHTFAVAKRELAHRAGTEDMDFAILKVLEKSDHDPASISRVIGSAREIWATIHGVSRTTGRHKFPHGSKSSSHCDLEHPVIKADCDLEKPVINSVADFLRNRRHIVSEAADAMSGAAPVDVRIAHAWTAKHDKEARFQTDKRKKRKIEQLAFCTVLDDEADDDLLREAAAAGHKQRKLDEAAWRARVRRDSYVEGQSVVTLEHFRGKTAMVCSTCQSPGLAGSIERAGVRVCVDLTRMDIEVIIVPTVNAESVGKKILWYAMLCGAYLVTPSFFTDRGSVRYGVAKYDAATDFWRRVFITSSFAETHPKLSVIIRSVSAQRVGSKWRCCDTKEAFNKEHAAAVRGKERRTSRRASNKSRGGCGCAWHSPWGEADAALKVSDKYLQGG